LSNHRRYEVGYGKPPVQARFKKGQSGNPGGRPKRTKRIDLALNAELNTVISLPIDGKLRSLTKLEAIARQLFSKAFHGNIPACEMFLEHMRRRDAEEPQPQFIVEFVKSKNSET
jgi:hypothetical protein